MEPERAPAPDQAAHRRRPGDAGPRSGVHPASASGPPRAAGLVQLQRTAGNRAVAALLAPKDPAGAVVQRDFVSGIHDKSGGKEHKHNKAHADQAVALVRTLKTEVEQLKAALAGPGTSVAAASAAARLQEIADIVRSQVAMVRTVTGPQPPPTYIPEMSQVANLAEGSRDKANTVAGERRTTELTDKVRTQAPAHLRRLEELALECAAQATAAVDAGVTELKGIAGLNKAAKAAAGKLDDARRAHDALVSLAGEAAGVPAAKSLAEAHLPPAQRALDVAVRMAGVAESVRAAWQAAFDRSKEAKTNFERAKEDAKKAEGDLEAATAEVDYLQGYNSELAIDVADWRKDPTADQGELDAILQDAARKFADAQQAKTGAAVALEKAKDNVGVVEKAERAEVRKLANAAKGLAGVEAGGIAPVRTDLEGLADLRDLAGGQDRLARLLAHIPDRAQVRTLLEVVGPTVALRWLDAATIGPAKATALLSTFGKGPLAALVSAIGEPHIDGLVGGVEAARLHVLVDGAGLGTAKVKELLVAGFTAGQVDAFATVIGLADLAAFLDQVSPATLKALAVAPDKLKALLGKMTAARVKALVNTLGLVGAQGLLGALSGTRVGELADDAGLGTAKVKELLAAGFTPLQVDGYATELGLAELKAFLGQVSAANLKTLAIAADKLKALLADVTGAEVKGIITELGAASVAGIVAELTPGQLRGLLAELPAATLKRLKLTGVQLKDLLTQYTAAELRGLATDLGDRALADLLTKFNAAEIKAYRAAVGVARFRELITVKQLKAKALHHYGSAMLATFVGADAATWAHLTGPPHISPVSGQISGGHDETVFLNYINQLVGPDPGVPRATLIDAPPVTPAPIYKVTYELPSGVQGSKTLIQNLTGNQATWLDRMNDAIWEGIRTLNFTWPAYSVSKNGWRFSGFYNGGDAVATAYPV